MSLPSSATTRPVVKAHVVYLVNFFAPDMHCICKAWSTRVQSLVILASVSMEGNRVWKANSGGLDVRVQKTWTRTRVEQHPGGYRDVNYVHVPLDTITQIRRARADVVVSSELGMRSILSALYCSASGWFGLRRRRCRLIIAVSTSPWIERSRSGMLRRLQRRLLLGRGDAVTYHGPQCRQWLLEIGVPEHKLFPFHYAADPTKIYSGPIMAVGDAHGKSLSLITVGQLIARKGVTEGLTKLAEVARRLPEIRIHWTLVGDGPLMSTLKAVTLPTNLHLDFRGNLDADAIRQTYREHEMMFFPTRGDEWGLVVDEALHSGLVVVGNDRAQSVVTLIEDGVNGYLDQIDSIETLESAIRRFTQKTPSERLEMRQTARQSVAERTAEAAATQITDLIANIQPLRR